MLKPYMPRQTLWDSICDLAGKEGTQPVSIPQAVENSAASAGIVEVELRSFVEQDLVRMDEAIQTLTLTEHGIQEAQGRFHTSEITGNL